jgi:hypothetical protein
MKKAILILLCIAVAPFVLAQTKTTSKTKKKKKTDATQTEKTEKTETDKVQTDTTQTNTSTAGGTISEFTPGEVMVVKVKDEPRSYKLAKNVVYVTGSGKSLDEAAVKERLKAGVPVHVDYITEGDSLIVSRVVLDLD